MKRLENRVGSVVPLDVVPLDMDGEHSLSEAPPLAGMANGRLDVPRAKGSPKPNGGAKATPPSAGASKESVHGRLNPGRPMDDARRAMTLDAQSKTVETGGLVPADKLSARAGVDLSPDLKRWESDKLIFSVVRKGKTLYPIYALDAAQGWKPIGAMKSILAVMHLRSEWNKAIWFASVNHALDGERPQDVLARSPRKVLKAAELEMTPPDHG